MNIRLVLVALGALGLPVSGALARVEPLIEPALSEKEVANLKRQVEPIMSLSVEDLRRLIPPKAGIYFVGCPNCEGGAQEKNMAWDFSRPNEIYCQFCGHRFPSEKYPANKVVKVITPAGNEVEYRAYEDPQTGYLYHFEARRLDLMRRYFSSAAYRLALLYWATKGKEYAYRSAVIIERFAEVYPDYALHTDLPYRQKVFYDGPPRKPLPGSPYRVSRWSWWAYGDIPRNLLLAYSLIYDSGALEELSADLRTEVKERIENDFFRASVEFVLLNPETLSNMSPGLWRSLIYAGQLLQESRYLQEAKSRLNRLLTEKFCYDGAWCEGAPSYHRQTIFSLKQVVDTLRGVGEAVEPEKQFPLYPRAFEVFYTWVLPDGRCVPVNDTWSTSRAGKPEEAKPYLLPSIGHACLARGQGEKAFQVHLLFNRGGGHQHADHLGIILWAYGKEMLSDIGYTRTRYRIWTIYTPSHNTVTVDGQSQAWSHEGRRTHGNLLFYDVTDRWAQAVAVDNPSAYPGTVQTYRRFLAAVAADGERNYVVDVFDVVGGSIHDYFLYGSADESQTLELATDLKPRPQGLLPEGAEFIEPYGESDARMAKAPWLLYGFLRQVKEGELPAQLPLRATFRYPEEGDLGLLVLLWAPQGCHVFTTESPALRPAKENDARLWESVRQGLLVRREGEAPTHSRFAAVHVPFRQTPAVKAARMRRLSETALALEVEWEDGKDLLLYAGPQMQKANFTWEGKPIVFRGFWGVLQLRGGRLVQAHVLGEELAWGESRLQGGGLVSGPLLSARRQTSDRPGALVTSGVWPREELPGRVALVVFADGTRQGFTIRRAVQEGDRTILEVEEDVPYLIGEDGKEVKSQLWPQWKFPGPVRVEVALGNSVASPF